MSFRTLWWRVKRPSQQEVEALRTYAADVLPHLQRVATFRDEWLDRRNREEEAEQLANAASVHRWEITRLVEDVRGHTPPARARLLHQDLLASLTHASRAFQLLATGSRYHRAEALCDGQALLLETADRLQHLAETLRSIQPKPAGAATDAPPAGSQ